MASGGLSGCATRRIIRTIRMEGFNRAMFAVNEGVDKVRQAGGAGLRCGSTAAGAGRRWQFLRQPCRHLDTPSTISCRARSAKALTDVGRVLINTTVGIGGVFDVASEMGLEKHDEDFGQTLGIWGVGDGPYFCLADHRAAHDARYRSAGRSIAMSIR